MSMDSQNSIVTTGILTITLHQARGLTASRPSYRKGLILTSSLPYAVIDFDKSQIISKPQSGSSDAPVWRCEYHRHNEFRHCFDVTRQTDLQIWLYQTAPAGADAGSSSFLGTATHRPSFKDEENSSAEWLDLHGGTGAVLIRAQFIPNRGFSLGMENFELLRVLDDSRGRHKLVKKRDTGQYYVILRSSYPKASHTSIVMRPVTAQIDSPFIASLKFHFKTSLQGRDRLAGVFVHNHQLSHRLESEHRFSLSETRFYAAQLVCALQCLHHFNIICGNLRLQDVYIDYTGHLLLANFDLFVLALPESNEARAAEYPAPGLVNTHDTHFPITKTVDWWSLGVIICEMLTGHRPFTAPDNHSGIHQTIPHRSLTFPDNNSESPLPPDAMDLVTCLLDCDLGTNASAKIKAHPFFDEIDWAKLLRKEYVPCFRPPHLDPVPAVYDTCRLGIPEVAPEVDVEALRQRMFKQFGAFMSRDVA